MRREHPRDGGSPVVADNVRATTGYRLDERRDVADEQVEAVVTAAGWWGAGRVAALIRGEGANPAACKWGATASQTPCATPAAVAAIGPETSPEQGFGPVIRFTRSPGRISASRASLCRPRTSHKLDSHLRC